MFSTNKVLQNFGLAPRGARSSERWELLRVRAFRSVASSGQHCGTQQQRVRLTDSIGFKHVHAHRKFGLSMWQPTAVNLWVMELLHIAALPCFSFEFPTTIGGAISDWNLKAGVELEVWSHTITSKRGMQYGAYLNHFWSAGGKGPIGTYIADRQVVRYYVDGEAAASIAFEPAMACGSGIGYERLGYYQAGYNMKEPWGPEMSNSMMGHSARSGGGWHNRFKFPFARSIRVTVQ
eukprot:SAG31_NODE_2435_length_5703_cov_2.125446_2_plen_235_part_00